ncbi:hypothetical protein FOA52_006843 [Chlamydomonas sp. UWO 241]|nr:hypothetical protein FOA52_006843 [Chlamydomonas sp. UWO 241]
MGLKFEVSVSTFDEKLPHDAFKSAAAYAIETARHKALEVAARILDADVVIGSDTVVEYGGLILEKPKDVEDAVRVLTSLSGSSHHVHTGVVLVVRSGSEAGHLVRAFSCTTNVNFDVLDEKTVRAYVESREPFGKAGSYGIQGIAGSFVTGISGCYFNVMGFPLHAFSSEMVRLIDEGHLKL